MRLRIPPPTRAGDEVLRLADLHKSYDGTVVYRGVDLLIRRGERIALVGPNGAGKSTLLRIGAGVLDFDSGDRTPGHNVGIAFYAQHQLEELDPRRSVLEELESAASMNDMPRLRSHLGAFLFSGDDVQKKVSVLSGGEKARLALAKLLLRPSNFLVLDEPTNHLDVSAREVLEEALGDYTGTLLFISHDRTLINALATRIVEVRAGSLRTFHGNYDDYLRALSEPRVSGPAPDPVPELAAPPAAVEAPTPGAPTLRPLSKRERVAAREETKQRTRRLGKARKRLASLEDEIRLQEEKLANLGWRLGDPELYRDGEAVREIEAQRVEIRESLDALYRDWERLAAEIESAEQVAELS
jgi:ATP-binding cassette subfamily F protein 3